ncbi:MAG: hypothetical protein JKY56_18670 [Kofleriaceae bacterium]|nr:hypothetical protein [Kofleriaceae bacterium]
MTASLPSVLLFMLTLGAYTGACSLPAGSSGRTHSTEVSVDRCTLVLSAAARGIFREQGLAQVSSYFPPGEGLAQERILSGRICATEALHRAIVALLEDTGPESLASLARDTEKEPDCSVRCLMNNPDSLFGIVGTISHQQQLLPMPPNGGRLGAQWIFFLSVPTLSNHGHWVFVSRRTGKAEVHSEN